MQDKYTDKYYKSNVGKIRYLCHYKDCYYQDWHNGIQLDIMLTEHNNNKMKRLNSGDGIGCKYKEADMI